MANRDGPVINANPNRNHNQDPDQNPNQGPNDNLDDDQGQNLAPSTHFYLTFQHNQ